MQAGGVAQGLSRRLMVLVAIALIAAMVALSTVLTGTLMTSTTEVETVIPNAGSALIHDDAGNVNPNVDLSGKVAGVH